MGDEMSIYLEGYVSPTLNENDAFTYQLNFGFLYALYGAKLGIDATANDLAAAAYSVDYDKIGEYYSVFTDPWQGQIQGLTDGFFSVNHNNVFDALKRQSGRASGTLYHYVFAEPNEGAMDILPSVGVAHTMDLTYTWG